MHRWTSKATLPVVAAAVAALLMLGGRADAQQGQTESVELFNGCNNVTVTWDSGTATSQVAAGVSPASNLRSIWRFNNLQQTFQGFSPQFPNASDLTTVNKIDAVFICMTGPGTLTRPLI